MAATQKMRTDDRRATDGAGRSPTSAGSGHGPPAGTFDSVADAAAAAAELDDGVGTLAGGGHRKDHSEVLLKEAQLANKAAPPNKCQKIQGEHRFP